MGSVLDLLARSRLLHEKGALGLVPRVAYQAGDPRSGDPLGSPGAFRGHGLNSNPWRAGLGLIFFAVGLGFAIWARVHIGRNWGTPMSQKNEPELVTSGPYRLVRHPIYSGILLAGVGTAVALSWQWLIAVALAGVYFVLQRDCRGALPDRRSSPTPTRPIGVRPRCSSRSSSEQTRARSA